MVDETNDKVYAAISTEDGAALTYKGNFIMSCNLLLVESSCTYVASQTALVGADY